MRRCGEWGCLEWVNAFLLGASASLSLDWTGCHESWSQNQAARLVFSLLPSRTRLFVFLRELKQREVLPETTDVRALLLDFKNKSFIFFFF